MVAVSKNTQPVPGTRLVPLEPDASTEMGVIISAGERRQHVRDLGSIAAAIGKDLFALIPDARAPAH